MRCPNTVDDPEYQYDDEETALKKFYKDNTFVSTILEQVRSVHSQK
jgi:hypothetical protein